MLLKNFLNTGFFFFLCIATAAFAQEKISGPEFKRFAEAFDEIQNINQVIQQKKDAVIKANGFTLERFESYGSALRWTIDHPDGPSPKTEEEKRYDAATAQINRFEDEFEILSNKAITNKGFTKDRYTDIRAELYKFARASTELGTITRRHQREVSAVIKDFGLEIDRFNELYKSYNDSTSTLPVNEETKRFEESVVRIKVMQEEFKIEWEQSIADKGTTLARLNELMALMEPDPAWPDRLRVLLE